MSSFKITKCSLVCVLMCVNGGQDCSPVNVCCPISRHIIFGPFSYAENSISGTFSGLAISSDRMVRNPVRDIRSTQPTLVVN